MSIEMKLLKVTLQMLIYILFQPFFKYIFKFHKMMVKIFVYDKRSIRTQNFLTKKLNYNTYTDV